MRSTSHKLAIIIALCVACLPVLIHAQTECEKALDALVTQRSTNAMALFTNSGKWIDDIGNYDNCNLNDDAHHCLIQFPANALSSNSSANTTGKIGSVALFWGLCLPANCSSSAVKLSLRKYIPDRLRQLGIPQVVALADTISRVANESQVTCSNDPRKSLSAGAIVMITLIVILCVLVIVSTALDILVYRKGSVTRLSIVQVEPKRDPFYGSTKYSEIPQNINSEQNTVIYKESDLQRPMPKAETKIQQLFTSFSALRNFQHLIAPQKGKMGVLNSVRVISMFWVIFGHSFLFWANLGGSGLKNSEYLLSSVIHRPSFQLIFNAPYSVDSFFFLSGFLLAYLLYERFHTKGNLSAYEWVMLYVHRWLRLTPIYAFYLFTYTYLMPSMGAGPFWSGFSDKFTAGNPCNQYWWTNMLYINNLVPWSKPLGGSCMSWAWYLANDMQFFVVTPPMIFLYYAKPRVGLALILLVVLVSSGVRFSMSYEWNLEVGFAALLLPSSSNNFERVYVRPWFRIGAYMVGVLFGLFYQKKASIKTKTWQAWLSWFVSAFIMITLLFATMGLYKNPPQTWPRLVSSVYNSVDRPLWVAGLGLVMFTFLTGRGGVIVSFLASPIWLPFARLTYGAYLVHPIWMTLNTASNHDLDIYSDSNLYFKTAGNIVMAYGLSFVSFLLLERPFMNLEKWAFTWKRKENKTL